MERKLIFNSALKLIRSGKFVASPMSEIAYHASLTESTAAYFFESRDKLVLELALHIAERIRSVIQDSYKNELSFETGFFKIWFSLYHFYTKNPEVMAFIEQSANLTPLCKEKLNEERLIEPLIRFFRSGPESMKARLQAETMASVFNGNIITAVKMKGSIDIKEEMEFFPKMLWAGIRAVSDS